MNNSKHILLMAGVICFVLALFQAVIGFSPSLSLYFGAPEGLAKNIYALIFVSFSVSGVLVLFGFYSLSGAGCIRRLPLLKHVLVFISSVYVLRGVLLIPELLIVFGVLDVSIPVAPRFIIFSMGSLLIGLTFMVGTVGGWKSFSSVYEKTVQQ